MKLQRFQFLLEDIELLKDPKSLLEHHTVNAHIAASLIHTARFTFHDIKNKRVANLGCGSGIICIGAALLKAKYCTGFDITPAAISLSAKNAIYRDVSKICDFILCDLNNMNQYCKQFDTVIMTLPMGTRDQTKPDVLHLKTALNMANNAVYLVYTPGRRFHVMGLAKKLSVYCKVIGELRFDTPTTYDFNENQVGVDLLRIAFTPE